MILWPSRSRICPGSKGSIMPLDSAMWRIHLSLLMVMGTELLRWPNCKQAADRPSRQLALHPLHQIVHLENLLVAERLALGNDLFALVIQHRLAGMKWVQAAARNFLLPRQHFLLHDLGYFRAKALDPDHAFAHTTPDLATFPATVEHRPGACGVVLAPLVGDGQDLRIGCDFSHIRVIRNSQLAALLRSGHHCR